ncbi:MAG: TIGR03643 family protein [Microscillaceae bacterium]|nr:TIGR03643 family protein [Microscillaceae bacterium]MDW8461546.1 TIGR03643 family protein [Cytophagales bacterium]
MSLKSIYDKLTPMEIDRIVEMAWEDRTPFDAIKSQFGLREQEVIALMRRELKPHSWKLWRERVKKISYKHAKKRPKDIIRFKCSLQRAITHNKISKR